MKENFAAVNKKVDWAKVNMGQIALVKREWGHRKRLFIFLNYNSL